MIREKIKAFQRFLQQKPIQYLLVTIYTILFIALFVPHFFSHSHNAKSEAVEKVEPQKIVNCQTPGNKIQVTVGANGFQPRKIPAKVCDILVITNIDQNYHQVAFGPHPDHLLYPSFEEKLLGPNQSNTFTLEAWGDYQLHDHLNESLEAKLEIKEASVEPYQK